MIKKPTFLISILYYLPNRPNIGRKVVRISHFYQSHTKKVFGSNAKNKNKKFRGTISPRVVHGEESENSPSAHTQTHTRMNKQTQHTHSHTHKYTHTHTRTQQCVATHTTLTHGRACARALGHQNAKPIKQKRRR